MRRKPFEELTISDDFMFCKVMEHESICKEFLEMLFAVKIEKITYLVSQNTVTTNSGSKTIRLDVLVKDKFGTSYDIEMFFPIDIPVYRKNEFCLVAKHRYCMEPAASVPLLSSVPPCTRRCSAKDGSGSQQNRVCSGKLEVKKCTRMYIS